MPSKRSQLLISLSTSNSPLHLKKNGLRHEYLTFITDRIVQIRNATLPCSRTLSIGLFITFFVISQIQHQPVFLVVEKVDRSLEMSLCY